MKRLVFLLVFTAAAFAQSQPRVQTIYRDQVACQQLTKLILGMPIACEPSISVMINEAPPGIAAYLVTVTYLDQGTSKQLSQVVPIMGGPGGMAGFLVPDGIVLLSTVVSTLAVSGTPFIFN